MRWGGIFDVEGLKRRIDGLNNKSLREGFWDNPEQARKLLAERAGLEQTVESFTKLQQEIVDLQELLELAAAEDDSGVVSEVHAQLAGCEARLRNLELARMLSGDEDRSDAIISINPGAGGVEAQDWAEMLMRMYLRYCERKGFATEVVSLQAGDDAGIKDVSIVVRGPFAYGFLRAESGVHRLIRISPYDSNARRHTSFAAVHVVPDLDDDVAIEIKTEDLRVDRFRASGAGGQHVNRTESAVRLTHIPTGIVVSCQAERSQHKNMATAMKMLRGRLYEKARQEQEAEFAKNYESQQMAINFGSQVRTYTLHPYTMVKDERTDHKATDAHGVLDGDLDEFVEAYLLKAASEREAQSKKESN